MKQQLHQTTCKRCGKPIVSSIRSLQHPLGRICRDCITNEERQEILEFLAWRILSKTRRS